MGKPKIKAICECCGASFIGYPGAKHCSAECRELISRAQAEESRIRLEARRHASESYEAIIAVNVAAKKAGLSYGQYVALNEDKI